MELTDAAEVPQAPAAESDHSSEIDEIERSKIGIIRALLRSQHSSSQVLPSAEFDDLMIRRFLRARDLDVEKASAMLHRYFDWRRAFVPDGSVSASEIPNEIAQNKIFMQGLDRIGRPVVVVFGARHIQSKAGTREFERFVVYCLDKICARMPRGQEKFIVVGEMEGWGYANTDIRGYLAALNILQDYYPERLAKLFLVHVPYVFRTAWKVVYPFIDSRTKKKIVFVEKKKIKETLVGEIEESQLADIYGGKLPLVPIQGC